MTEDSHLPAVIPPAGHMVRLDDATRKVLKEAEFDPRVLEAVMELGKVGIRIKPEEPPSYVLMSFLETMEGLRKLLKTYTELTDGANVDLRQLKRDYKKMAKDGAETEKLEKLQGEIDQTNHDLNGWAAMYAQLTSRKESCGRSISELQEKLKQPAPPPEGGSPSWDPDAPHVNLQVNVSPGASVSVHEKG